MKTTLDANKNSNVFLVQRKVDDGDAFQSLMDERSLAEYLNFLDLHNEEYDIWRVSNFGTIEHCRYLGWQPGCHIQVVRECDNKIVVDAFGEDH